MNQPKSQSTEKQRELRQRIMEKLGGRCVRCGFDDWRALQIDYVRGGGRGDYGERLGRFGGGMSYYYRVLHDETGKYQLLCANCNQIKRLEGKEAQGMRQHKVNKVDVSDAVLRMSAEVHDDPQLGQAHSTDRNEKEWEQFRVAKTRLFDRMDRVIKQREREKEKTNLRG